MAKEKKKQVRRKFQFDVYLRDDYKCVMCSERAADAHHITDRNLMPHGGYVKENGISLCEECHFLAEEYHRTGTAVEGYSPKDLYEKIGSSKEIAKEKSEMLGS